MQGWNQDQQGCQGCGLICGQSGEEYTSLLTWLLGAFRFFWVVRRKGLTFLEVVGQRASSAPGHVGLADMTTGFLTACKEASPWKTGVTTLHNMITDVTFYCLYCPEWVEASHGSHPCSRGRTSQRRDHQETMGTSTVCLPHLFPDSNL